MRCSKVLRSLHGWSERESTAQQLWRQVAIQIQVTYARADKDLYKSNHQSVPISKTRPGLLVKWKVQANHADHTLSVATKRDITRPCFTRRASSRPQQTQLSFSAFNSAVPCVALSKSDLPRKIPHWPTAARLALYLIATLHLCV